MGIHSQQESVMLVYVRPSSSVQVWTNPAPSVLTCRQEAGPRQPREVRLPESHTVVMNPQRGHHKHETQEQDNRGTVCHIWARTHLSLQCSEAWSPPGPDCKTRDWKRAEGSPVPGVLSTVGRSITRMKSDQVSKQLRVDLSVITEPRGPVGAR